MSKTHDCYVMKHQGFRPEAKLAAEAAVEANFPTDNSVERHLSREDLAVIVAAAVQVALDSLPVSA